ncbi:MAG: hypothetical protein JWM88_1180 [Verrucomicrobia bacterium]|nr:hypothetical protein [Verrucomicrobiota bacterium]
MRNPKTSSRIAAGAILTLACAGAVVFQIRQRRLASNPPRQETIAGSFAPSQKLSFNEDIEPILSENCYVCHGPDPGTRKAGLRLDRPEFALAPHEKSGPAIVRGKPDQSPLVERVESPDPKHFMPPPEAHRTLKPAQVARLRRWVQEGAEYQEHWSFIPPLRAAPPATKISGWARNDIDRFVLARLEREGLSPSPEADRRTLLRRVSYDLTGLPPTPEEANAFVRDPSPDAYEKVVDRLLASPRYGEHRAHYWLDVVRYADTHGLHMDKYRSVWPYRDYVIRSFNQNKPFDQFTREQLAGDLLPAENVEQLVATAMIRSGISNSEGGSIEEELRTTLQKERTEAFGAVYLGMTVGCATCHDHKFDPTTQKDFYRLTAFFNNLAEFPSNKISAEWPPFVRVPREEKRPAFDAVLAERAALQRELAARQLDAPALVAAWLKAADSPPRHVSSAALELRLRLDEGQGSNIANSAPGAAARAVTLTGAAPEWGENTWFWPTFRMAPTTRVELPECGNMEARQAFSVGTWLMPQYEDGASLTPPFGTILARADSTADGRGWGLYLDGEGKPSELGRLCFRLAAKWPANAIEVKTVKSALARARGKHVLATNDGSGKAPGGRRFSDGVPQAGSGTH